jgi:hypothetical protein
MGPVKNTHCKSSVKPITDTASRAGNNNFCTVKGFLHRDNGPKTFSAMLALKAFAMGYFT